MKLVKNERGITLIELLATFVVMTIVMTVVYNVFANGIGVAKKIGIEGQLRDDADYVVTMMMNELAAGEFDEVRACSDNPNCIELIDNQSLGFTEYYKDGETVYDIEKKSKDATTTRIELIHNETGRSHFEIDGKIIDAHGDFTGSTLLRTCSSASCSNGIINITLVVDSNTLNNPLTLESKFGF